MMHRFAIATLLFFFSTNLIYAQENHFSSEQPHQNIEAFGYELSSKDYGYIGAALILNGAAFILRESLSPPTLLELENLDRSDINRFDRAATYNWSPKASDWSDRTEIMSILLPAALLHKQAGRDDALKLLLMGAETIAINQGLTDLSKSITRRYRPLAYNENAPLDARLSKNARLSFYSGHTSASAAFCFFTATTFSTYYPDSRLKPYIWTAAISLPAITGWLRYEAGKHFLTDVIVAYGMGALTGYLIPRMHLTDSTLEITSSFEGQGLSVRYRF